MKYTSGYKYQIAEDYTCFVPFFASDAIRTRFIDLQPMKKDGHLIGLLRIRQGYAWDGASGPTYDTSDTMTPSLVHDVGYQLMRNYLLPQSCRSVIDEHLGVMMKERASNIWGLKQLQRWRANRWVNATHLFAAGAANPKNRKKIVEVI